MATADSITFAHASIEAIGRRLSFDDLQELDLWVGNACAINWDLRLAKDVGRGAQRILDALTKASAIVEPGSVVWRGSAWVAQVGFSWREPTFSCSSTDRRIAARFVDDPGYEWPSDADHITIDEVLATPSLARITIGSGVRAVALSQILEPHAHEPGLLYTVQGVSEQEVTLLPCAMRVTSVGADGIVEILAGEAAV